MISEIMSIDEYDNKYQPVLEDDEPMRFDNYNDAIEYVEKHFTKNMPYRHIWSAVDGDNNYFVMLNGFHICNLLYYEVCENTWGTENHEDNGNIDLAAEEAE